MKILRHEGRKSHDTEILYGVAIQVNRVGVIHIYAIFYRIFVLRKNLLPAWRVPYTGRRKLKLNRAWQ